MKKMKLLWAMTSKLAVFIRKPASLVFLYFIAMTIIMTFPLILHMGQIVGGGGGDGTYFVWLVRWYQKALFELHISPFFNPDMNYPQGWHLTGTDVTPSMVLLGLPAGMVFGPVWGYNFSMLLSFVLSGWGMYLWVRKLTKDGKAGLVAGTIYAFLPYHMAHFLIGHLPLSGMQWFPFYFWGLYELLTVEKFSWKPVLIASISAGLIGFTAPYYIYMTILISAVFVLWFILFKGYQRFRSIEFWKNILAFGLLAALLVGLAMFPYLQLSAQNGLTTKSLDYVSEYSASPTDFVIPSLWHFLWGGWVDRTFSPEYWQEATLYIGAVAFVLVVIAWIKRREFSGQKLLWIASLTAFSAFILALGSEPHWLGRKVTSLPTILQPIFHRVDMPEIHLPAYYLYQYLPFFSIMRVMMRFGLFTLVFTSMMAGLGAYLLLKSIPPKYKNWMVTGLLLLVFIDFYPGVLQNIKPIQVRAVDRWLATQPNIGAVAQFPFYQESDQGQVYNTLIHQKPYLGGFFNANPPEQYSLIYPVMEYFPSQESVDLLQELGVAYVVVDATQYDDFSLVDQNIQNFGLRKLFVDSNDFVYGLPK